MDYSIDIAGLHRDLPMFPVSDDTMIAALILFGDVELTEHCAKKLLERAPEFDIILTAEAKSIPLAYEMAKQAGMNDYVIARKRVKVYMGDVIKASLQSITTKGSQELFLGRSDFKKLANKRVLIVDDVVSTGDSLRALEMLADTAHANIVGKMCILEEGDSLNRPDVIALGELPLFNADGSVKSAS